MLVRLRSIAEQLRASLLFVPLLFIGMAMVLAWAINRLDRSSIDLSPIPFILDTTVPSARALLGTVAGATITVAGIVFSVTLVSVQLASSQFSPRVMRGFLRDRFQQMVIGIVLGTFTYALVTLAVTHADTADETVSPSLSVTVALGLGVVAVLAIVAFIDRSTRTMQVSEMIARISNETLERARQLHQPGERSAGLTAHDGLPTAVPQTLVSYSKGWIQQIDQSGLLSGLPPHTIARLDARVGQFVSRGDAILTVWEVEDAEDLESRINGAFAFGRVRTMQEDVPFGITQLGDIALRALSPGINDPTTAIEAIQEIGAVLGEILIGDLPPRIVTGPEGRRLYRPLELDRSSYVELAFSQIRRAAVSQPAVIEVVITQLGRIASLFIDDDRPLLIEPLRREARLAVAGLRDQGLLDADVEPIASLAEQLGLLDRDLDQAPGVDAGTE